MPNIIEGTISRPEGRFAIVAARFNREIVERLVDGAMKALVEHGVADDAIDLAWVPGSFEIPLTAKHMARSGKYAAVVCLGAVIRGETDHYEHICNQAAAGIMQAGLETGVPISFGVLTCQTEELALARSGGNDGNKGHDAALAAIEMASLFQKLPPPA